MRRQYEARPEVKARRKSYYSAWRRKNAAGLARRRDDGWTRLVRARARSARELARAEEPGRVARLARLLRMQDEAIAMMRKARDQDSPRPRARRDSAGAEVRAT